MQGIWQRLFEGTVVAGPGEKLLLDGTICKAHRSATGARGGAAEDIGRARGGLTTKIGASVCAKKQKIVRVILAPGQRNDCVLAAQMLGQAEAITVIADKAFDTDPVQQAGSTRMHRPDPLKGQSPSAEKAQKGSLPPETRHRECLLPGEGFGPHHPTPRQDQHLLPRLHPPRLRYPQHPTRQLPGQGRPTLSVDPRGSRTPGWSSSPAAPGDGRSIPRRAVVPRSWTLP